MSNTIVKKKEKKNFKVTSVNLSYEQYEYIQKENIELSETIRNYIDTLMKGPRRGK